MTQRLRILIVLLILFVATHWSKWGDDAEGNATAGVVYKLLSCIVIAVIGGFYVVGVILPKLGDAAGTMMYSSGEVLERPTTAISGSPPT